MAAIVKKQTNPAPIAKTKLIDFCNDCRLYKSFPSNCLKDKENNSPINGCRMKKIIEEYGILLPVPMGKEEAE